MRLRNVKGANELVKNCKYTINEPEKYKGKFKELFGNDNEIHVEIGMGKGDFIIGKCLLHPEINFIGIEKYESVMVRAIDKLKEVEVPNLRLIRFDATNIDSLFEHEISTIYLNFSDPWPKARHEKRRLTSPVFLNLYDCIFAGNPHIVQKTDNIGLFAYSIESLSNYGYTFDKVSLDIETAEVEDVETEYEKKFKSLGVKINYLDAVKKK